jgi:predicted phage terminase large subunit-like protein
MTDSFDFVEKAQNNLISFARAMKPNYQFPWHLQKLMKILERVESGELTRVMIMFPPRHGKSETASVLFPTWFAGRNPDKEIMLVSGTQRLATRFGLKARNIITSPMYKNVFPEVELDPSSHAKTEFSFTSGGNAFYNSVGGQITGRGAHLFILDDLIPGAKEADSEVTMDNLKDWYYEECYNRLMSDDVTPHGRIVLIGCLTGDTLITMGNGTYKQFKDILVGDSVLSWKENKPVIKKVVNVINQGPDTVYEVKTKHSIVKGNAKHPLLVDVAGKRQWKRIKDLLPGDKLVINQKIIANSKRKLKTNQAWLLGFMFGDGWITTRKDKRNNQCVTCVALSQYPILNRKIRNLFKKIFNIDLKDTKYGYAKTEWSFVGHWFKNLGLTGKAKTKRLPHWLFSQPKKIRDAFLSGLIEADGHTTKKYNQTTLELSNLQLIQDVRHLARGLGHRVSNIYSRTRLSQPPHSPKPIKAQSHHIQWGYKKYTDSFQTSEIQSIKKIGIEDVYDMQIEETENFFADGIVSHNTRWRTNDIQGWLLDPEEQEEIDDWHIFRFPAIAEEDEEFRKEGEALWPDKYSTETLNKIRNKQARVFNGAFQQNPTIETGNIVQRDWLNVEKVDETTLIPPRMLFLDTAFKEGKENDYSAACVLQRTKTGIVVLFSEKRRMNFPDLIEWTKALAKIYNIQGIGIEDKASGQSLIQTLRDKTRLPVIAIPVKRNEDKVSRLHAIVPYLESKRVTIHKFTPASNRDALITELLEFPLGGHDDQVDAFVHGVTYLLRPSALLKRLGRKGLTPDVDIYSR